MMRKFRLRDLLIVFTTIVVLIVGIRWIYLSTYFESIDSVLLKLNRMRSEHLGYVATPIQKSEFKAIIRSECASFRPVSNSEQTMKMLQSRQTATVLYWLGNDLLPAGNELTINRDGQVVLSLPTSDWALDWASDGASELLFSVAIDGRGSQQTQDIKNGFIVHPLKLDFDE